MFLVVQFQSTGEVGVVPESWYDDGVCWWPDYQKDERVARAVRNTEEPGDEWQKHDVRKLVESDDYLTARRKLRQSEYCKTDDLQSEKEEEGTRKKRKRVQRLRYGEGDESEEEERESKSHKARKVGKLPPAPELPAPLQIAQASPTRRPEASQPTTPSTRTCPPSSPSPPPRTPSPPSPPPRSPSPPPRSPSPPPRSPSPPPRTPSPPSPPPRTPGIQSLSGTEQGIISIMQRTPTVTTPVASTSDTSETPRRTLPTSKFMKSGGAPVTCTAAELQLMKMMENMNLQQKQMAGVLNTIMAALGSKDQPAEIPEELAFPLNTMADLDELEEWLRDAQKSVPKKNLVSVFAALGGSDVKRVTWNILAHVFKDSLAKKINWKGVNGKRSFDAMATKSLIIRSVRKNVIGRDATDEEVIKHIIRWFNVAPDRDGGRKARYAKNNN